MAKSKPWKLDPAEVSWSTESSTSTKRKKRRQSRQLDERSQRVLLRHVPTGIVVTGEIPTGHYSRKEMEAARNALIEKLFVQLEAEVGRHLRVPGW